MADITRNTTLPDSAAKSDFHNLIDTATVQIMKPATDSTTALKLANSAATAILNVDTTNSRVGIGTTSPTSTLDVTGTLTCNDASNANPLNIVNDGTGKGLFIDQNGNQIALDIDSEATTLHAVNIDTVQNDTKSSFIIKHSGVEKLAINRLDVLNEDVAIILGTYYLWVDATGDLRIKGSAPSSDLDGTVVGTQS